MIDRKKKPWTAEETKKHISSQVESSSVTAVTGEEVALPVGDNDISLCCHSDSPGAVNIVTAARYETPFPDAFEEFGLIPILDKSWTSLTRKWALIKHQFEFVTDLW